MIRRWQAADAEASYAVYVDAVRNGTGRHYTAEQARAWVPSDAMEDWWSPRLKEGAAWVSEDASGLNGLIALRPDGYLDLFFVPPRARGTGIASELYDRLAKEAAEQRLRHLSSHASDYLKPFLEKRGWSTLKEEIVTRNGIALRRWAMTLDQAAGSQRS